MPDAPSADLDSLLRAPEAAFRRLACLLATSFAAFGFLAWLAIWGLALVSHASGAIATAMNVAELVLVPITLAGTALHLYDYWNRDHYWNRIGEARARTHRTEAEVRKLNEPTLVLPLVFVGGSIAVAISGYLTLMQIVAGTVQPLIGVTFTVFSTVGSLIYGYFALRGTILSRFRAAYE